MDNIKYEEGQWFAVPLVDSGYALGIIVRGNLKYRGGVGYFFGPRNLGLPEESNTIHKNPKNALSVMQFGDLGIINGSWPLILTTEKFEKSNWPLPLFAGRDPVNRNIGYIRKYNFTDNNNWLLVSEKQVMWETIANLPPDMLFGYKAVEMKLTKLIDEGNSFTLIY